MKSSFTRMLFHVVVPLSVFAMFASTGCTGLSELQVPVEFTGTLETLPDTKTQIGTNTTGNRTVFWNADDLVCIGGQVYEVRSLKDSLTATFTTYGETAQIEDGVYKAFYPASILGNGTPVLPATQIWQDKRIDHLPMYAESSTKNLAFKNLCTIISVRLKRMGVIPTIGSIVVTTTKEGQYLSGPFTLGWNNGDPAICMTGGTGSSQSVTLDLGADGVTLSALVSKEFLIALPPQLYEKGKLTIQVLDLEGKVLESYSSNDDFNALRSHYYDISKDISSWVYTIDRLRGDISIEALAENINKYQRLYTNVSTPFKSFRTKGGKREPVEFKMQYSASESGPWIDGLPDWLDVKSPSSFNGSTSGENLTIAIVSLEEPVMDPNSHTQELRSRAEKVNFDLSTLNVATGETVERTTANSYVVQAPGTYRFPLVYGNALRNGSIYEPAFHRQQNTQTGPTYLNYWLDHNNEPITNDGTPTAHAVENSVYIAKRFAGQPLEALLLWEDEQNLVSEISIDGTGEDAYICFTVPQATIQQGNAVIALRAGSDIVWSWHIWVTDSNLTAVGDGFYGFRFAPYCVGWCDGWSYTIAEKKVYIRAVQTADGGNATQPVPITQRERNIYARSHALYYQFGRKDPFIGYLGGVNKNKDRYENPQYPYENIPGPVSVGEGIRQPYAFFYVVHSTNVYPPDWCAATIYNYWNSSQASDSYTETNLTKTIYDPSPSGFMAAPRSATNGMTSEIASFVNTTNLNPRGFIYNGIFFPALGYRIHQEYIQTPPGGIMGYDSMGGHYTCTGNSTWYGRVFSFYESTIWGVNTNVGSIRANAEPVHPVVEPY